MHAFSIFVSAPVQRNVACFTWKSALEIRSIIIIVINKSLERLNQEKWNPLEG